MNEVWVLSKDTELFGVYSTYQKAMHAIMMNACLPLSDFSYQFGVDFYTDSTNRVWSLESKTMDEM